MLYHFSEEPSIQRFVPRAPLAHPEVEPLVWTVPQQYEQVYWLPRDCPRVCFWPVATTTPDDLQRLWIGVDSRMVIAIEAAWLARVQSTSLYRYTMPPETFEPLEDFMYVSRETVEPVKVEPMGNLLDALAAAPVEVRICPLLRPIGEAIIGTSFSWHIIRRRNAQQWPDD